MSADEDASSRGAFMTRMGSLLNPRRIAIVGASPRPGYARSIHNALLAGEYDGEIVPINPRYDEVLGLPAYPSLAGVPGAIDLAIVVVSNRLVFDVLDDCERSGVGAVSLIASGFAEKPGDALGEERQRRIREFALRTGIRVSGPNCLGNISVSNRMNAAAGPYFSPLPGGPVAAVLQSGLLSYSLIVPCVDRGIGFTYVVTSGNEADLTTADYIRYFVEDDETRVIGCFVEQFRDPSRFLEAAELAAERRKPIVALKIGRSAGGQRAARAHTGSLVGSDDIAAAVMRQHGIIRVNSMDEMIETLAVCHARKLPKSDGVGAVFMSGGAAGMVSDLGQDLGLRFPALAPETVERLSQIIPDYGTIDNPLDTTGGVWTQPGAFQASFRAIAADPGLDIILYGRPFPGRMEANPDMEEFPASLPEEHRDKLFFIMSLVTGRHREKNYAYEQMLDPIDSLDSIPFLQGTENSLRAIRSLMRYAEFQRARAERDAPDCVDESVVDAARQIVTRAGGTTLTERESKRVLALYGLPVTREALAASADEAVMLAREIGYPVALKIESSDIPHKTEASGVLLGVENDDDVMTGFGLIIDNARAHAPDAKLDGVLVQQVAPDGHELLLGMSQDADFGPAIVVGFGGVWVETLRDTRVCVPPLSKRDARAMLESLRGFPILEGSGARGAGPSDLDAVVDILARFSRLAIDVSDLVCEIDINPLVVFEQGSGALVVDCLIVPRQAGAGEAHEQPTRPGAAG
ncbi:MAG TPA: acetate--CoA ligase family protein [Thermomicrobiales bacterium]|nr:acetate--CoA ligase family protein [Thermomicrobiales bacterium]